MATMSAMRIFIFLMSFVHYCSALKNLKRNYIVPILWLNEVSILIYASCIANLRVKSFSCVKVDYIPTMFTIISVLLPGTSSSHIADSTWENGITKVCLLCI